MSRPLLPTLSRSSHRQKPPFSVRPFYWALFAFTGLALLSWSFGNLNNAGDGAVHLGHNGRPSPLLRRDDAPDECRLVRNAKDKCSFVRSNCPDHEDGLFSYLQFYYCTLPDAKPVAFVILILWLSLLFSTIGIAASDFLCIDLSTLASILGLSESLTGVTFLAFGNGSPDVFSTFAAMRSNSGSLAIGELIGAASFITSVVAGSMALVRPFKVARRSFVRDVGYFIIAVSFSMLLLADGHLHIWEAATMVGLYCFYVALVVTWHWYILRRRRTYERTLAARSHFHIPENQELEIEEEEDDEPQVASESTNLLSRVSTQDFDSLERADLPAWKDGDGEEDDETRNRYLAEIRDNMHVYRPSSTRRNTLNPIRPSLVGALEFQSVLSSLQRSRNVHQNVPISLERYSDNEYSDRDNISVASHPSSRRPTASDRLSPPSGPGSRTRAVSANDAARLKLDASVFGSDVTRPQVMVTRPSAEGPHVSTSPPSTNASRSPSPDHTTASQTPTLLAPPNPFHSPNYQAETPSSRSPVDVSPRGTTYATGPENALVEGPSSPFPPYLDVPGPTSSRPPSIHLPPGPSPTELLHIHDSVFEDRNIQSTIRRSRWGSLSLSFVKTILPTLFPTLDGWKGKSFWEKILGVVAAPSVFLLTITIHVVDPVQQEPTTDPITVVVTTADDGHPAPPVRLPEDSPLLSAMDRRSAAEQASDQNRKSQSMQGRRRWDSELPPVQPAAEISSTPPRESARWLTMLQFFTGPFFVALIFWTTTDDDLHARKLLLPSLCALLFSLVCLGAFVISTRRDNPPHPPAAWRPFLAFLGFIVAICWIATIATEVVNLLKTLGVVLNISDSLLGLTVFAVGNSLGDLVADITVARLGYPVMALSACFGGPMLNILLGIGLGGLYMTMNAKPETIVANGGAYQIAISKVLIISGATLLTTLVGLLVVVPLNKWRMDRRIGWGLVVLWSVSTLANVIAELVT
ncbi:Sodium/calcium exchanger protein-domain-containing protein [Aspergillus ambiguus]|uniref:sodium/calcium exchanger protein n=1 Tax=Aspergillus ambiguus TaxID=176160 RepID=UPI003CCCB870